jgi:hypothetical protein
LEKEKPGKTRLERQPRFGDALAVEREGIVGNATFKAAQIINDGS